jgi:hypothetical protein
MISRRIKKTRKGESRQGSRMADRRRKRNWRIERKRIKR